ncbi:winged helix-turn-helix domain-containing protein [Marinomonas pollencensis]|uniref:Winged helix-turn-helix domain-containing protein n=1 Tax=Marinomonas pollencensis TaxID=491954 RepID=A0A3E0DF15_9GAMM|nr:crosslink repair DNA glycosylase YcaQ family protein [Marinomonas pollencensis]REG81296.1 hypothetical protein DFP81_11517 [Marinomonas pollencensis]
MLDTLSISQARKLALISQKLPRAKYAGISGTLGVIQHLGYIQIDSISVVSRAHHHTLWNRVVNYQSDFIDTLLEQQQIFEYWSHAAAYLPIEDFRYSLAKKAHIKAQKHWFERDQRVEKEVLTRIRSEGPLQAKDFQKPKNHTPGWWRWKPAKQALEQLFMAGELMCPKRIGFQKVYDLTERVLPQHLDLTMPSQAEIAQHLITQGVRSHGLVQAQDLSYLRTGLQASIKEQIQAMLEEKQLQKVRVNNQDYLTTDSLLAQLSTPISRQQIKLLSPFDNLVIQRKRLKRLFDFDYRIECYLPADKRQYGYYALPIIWQGELVARMDAKAERKTGLFIIKNIVLESKHQTNVEAFCHALIAELEAYANFNRCPKITLLNAQPATLKVTLSSVLMQRYSP